MGYGNIGNMVGSTFASVRSSDDEVYFVREDGSGYRLHHEQDCCERVYLEDIIGDLSDLENSPIVEAYETSDDSEAPEGQGSERYEWTFYRIRTIQGTVTLRFYGESDYYSTSVTFSEI